MQAKNRLLEQPTAKSFIEAARRRQIVTAAIEVIARVGYAQASFAKIAKRAKLSSTGIISYHFDSRADLVKEVVAEVSRVADAHVRPRIEAHRTNSARLRAYIEASLEVMELFPEHLEALLSILSDARAGHAVLPNIQAQMDSVLTIQAERMREAQRMGDFRDFDALLMATTIRGAIDAAMLYTMKRPEVDVKETARQLADTFELATRRNGNIA